MRSMKTFKNTISIIAALITISMASAATAQTSTEARCLVDAPENIDTQDALAAADVVCQDVRAHGVAIAEPSTAGETDRPSETYRVKLRELGEVTVLTLSHEDTAGRVLRSERVQLKGLEELLVVGPRLTEALMTAVPLEKTASVTTLTHEETRAYNKKTGEFLWGVSVEGLVLTQPFMSAPGLGLHAVYETPGAALTAKAAFHVKDMDDDSGGFNLSVGGRKIFGDTDTAFYAGGGMAWSGYFAKEYNDNHDNFYDRKRYEGMGFEAYGEAGVELFRFYEARVLFGARAALPLYMIESREYEESVNADGTYDHTQKKEDFYMVPITLSATLLW